MTIITWLTKKKQLHIALDKYKQWSAMKKAGGFAALYVSCVNALTTSLIVAGRNAAGVEGMTTTVCSEKMSVTGQITSAEQLLCEAWL